MIQISNHKNINRPKGLRIATAQGFSEELTVSDDVLTTPASGVVKLHENLFSF